MGQMSKDEINSTLIDAVQSERGQRRNLEKALNEIIILVKSHDEELAYDCERIADKWSQS